MSSGIAIRTTSSGSATMFSPLIENMTTIVNSRAISVIGLIRGMNTPSYHSRPRRRISTTRVRNPAMNGMPR